MLDTKTTNPLSRSNASLRLCLDEYVPESRKEEQATYSTNLIYRLTCFVLLALGDAVLHGKGEIIGCT